MQRFGLEFQTVTEIEDTDQGTEIDQVQDNEIVENNQDVDNNQGEEDENGDTITYIQVLIIVKWVSEYHSRLVFNGQDKSGCLLFGFQVMI